MASRLWRLLPAFFLLFGPVAPAFGAGQPAAKKDPDPRAWPVAYEAPTTTLQDVLDGAKKADNPSAAHEGTLRVTYALREGGLDGTERDVWSGDDYRVDETIGRFVTAEGRYHGQRWEGIYDDYNETRGGAMPYRTTVSDGHPENDAVFTITDLKVDAPVTPAEVSIPDTRRFPRLLPGGVPSVRLPARIDDWGRIIVRLTVQGRGLDFQLDSGAAGIVITRDVANELKLKTYGRWSSTVAGTFTSTRAIIPKIGIGTVVMNDVVVEALPFAFQNDYSTRIVGLLGYDFIAGCVVKIDYEHGTVDALPSETFQPPAKGFTLDAIMDDQVPIIWSKFNDAVGERFILDTGADDIVVFSGFAKKHPAAVEDHSPKQILSRLFNILQADGVGGKLNVRPVMIANMQVGNVSYRDYLAFVMSGDQPAFEGEDLDGLIGASALRMFDVYLDYANSRVVLVPNGRTRPRRPDDK